MKVVISNRSYGAVQRDDSNQRRCLPCLVSGWINTAEKLIKRMTLTTVADGRQQSAKRDARWRITCPPPSLLRPHILKAQLLRLRSDTWVTPVRATGTQRKLPNLSQKGGARTVTVWCVCEVDYLAVSLCPSIRQYPAPPRQTSDRTYAGNPGHAYFGSVVALPIQRMVGSMVDQRTSETTTVIGPGSSRRQTLYCM